MKNTVWKQCKNFWKDEEGATAVEYGVMVALIIAIMVLVIKSVGEKTKAGFDKVDGALPAAPAAPPAG